MRRPEPVYRVKDAAPLAGVCPDYLKQLINEGHYFRNAYQATGGRTSPWLVPESDITEYRRSRVKARVA